MGTGREPERRCRQTKDIKTGTGMGAGTKTRAVTEMGTGTRIGTGMGMRAGTGRSKERRRSARDRTRVVGACHYLPNRFQMKAPVAPSRSLREAFKRAPRSLRGACLREGFAEPPRRHHEPFAEVYETLRGGCPYRRFHEDALEGSRGLLEGSVDELHVPTRS